LNIVITLLLLWFFFIILPVTYYVFEYNCLEM